MTNNNIQRDQAEVNAELVAALRECQAALARVTAERDRLRERLAELEYQKPFDDALIAQQHVDAMIYRDQRDALRVALTEAVDILDDAWHQWAYPGKGGKLWAGGLSVLKDIEVTLPGLRDALEAAEMETGT